MAMIKDQAVLVKKLRQQVKLLQAKEDRSRRKLKIALKKINALSKTYKNKLAIKARLLRSHIGRAKASAYAKAASELEKKVLKDLDIKNKSLSYRINKNEREKASKLKRGVARKGKKTARLLGKSNARKVSKHS